MNNITLIGRLGKDVELKYTQGGVAIATGSIAVKRNYFREGQQDTDWLFFKCLGKRGENMAKYFSKGSEIALKGAYQRDQWEDGEGYKDSNYIMVDSWEFTGGSKKESNEGFNGIDENEFQAIEDSSEIPF